MSISIVFVGCMLFFCVLVGAVGFCVAQLRVLFRRKDGIFELFFFFVLLFMTTCVFSVFGRLSFQLLSGE